MSFLILSAYLYALPKIVIASLNLAMVLIPLTLSCGELQPDPVSEFVSSQPQIAIDITGLWSVNKKNCQLKKKNFKPRGR